MAQTVKKVRTRGPSGGPGVYHPGVMERSRPEPTTARRRRAAAFLVAAGAAAAIGLGACQSSRPAAPFPTTTTVDNPAIDFFSNPPTTLPGSPVTLPPLPTTTTTKPPPPAPTTAPATGATSTTATSTPPST